MKTLKSAFVILICISLFSAVSCGRRRGKSGISLKKKQGRYTTGGTHEKVTCYYGNGFPNEILTFDGSKRIMKTLYHKNGKLWAVIHFNGKDMFHGSWKEWYDDESKQAEKNYVNNLKHGTFKEWYSNGNRMSEKQWDMGNPVGIHKEWYEFGAVKSEIPHANGLREGVAVYNFDNGRKEKEITYKDGKKNGPATYFYQSGNKEKEEGYLNDQLHGICQRFLADGRLHWKIGFENGKKHGPDIAFDNMGAKIHEGQNAGGKKIGHWVYFKNGLKDYEGDYENGRRNGTFTYYGPGGGVIREELYDEGVKQ